MVKRTRKTKASVKRGDFPEGEKGVQQFLAAKLRELAGGRLQKAVRYIRNIGRLGRYRPSEAQTKFAFDLLAQAMTKAHAQWQGTPEAKEEVIVLPNA